MKSLPERFRIRGAAAVPLACAGLVFVVALGLYVWTLAPTVTLVDSGELIVAAHELGVAHPPGFPLYVMLAHLATRVPLGNVAVRVNFASALFAALAAGLVVLAVGELLRPALDTRRRPEGGRASRNRRKRGTLPAPSPPTAAALEMGPGSGAIVAAAAGLLFACSRTLWSYATVAEVYTLNAMLLVAIVLLMLRWRRGRLAATPGDGWLYGAALLFGLALGVHHVTVVLALPALAILVFSTEGQRFFTSRRLLYALGWALAGLSVYIYLPLAASRSPLMNWGDPRTLERLWWHVTGRQYQVFFTSSADIIGHQLRDFIGLAAREFGPWWLPVALACAVVGFVTLARDDRTMLWTLLATIGADVAYAVSYEIAEDKDAYYLPSFIALTMAAGVGLYRLAGSARRLSAVVARSGSTLVMLLVPAIALAANLPYDDRSRFLVARDYVENFHRTIEPGGMLLTLDWQVYSPLLYLREVERRRIDIVAIDINQLRRSWYFDYLRRAYPELLDRSRVQVEAFLEDLRRWENDPALYVRDAGLNRRISVRFHDMILAFVSDHLRRAPVYVTQDVALNPNAGEGELARALAASYQLVPQGLAFQLFPDRQFHEPSSAPLETRGLVDGSLRFGDDDVVRVKVLPVYVNMLANRGRYLALHARHAQAVAAYRQALTLSPDSRIAQESLEVSQKAMREGGS